MGDIPKTTRFDTVYKLRLEHKVKYLCKITKVSIAWYYKHKNLIEEWKIKEIREYEIMNKIKEIYEKYRWKYWYRRISMVLWRRWEKINIKKIRRIMKKYKMLWKIRRKNPYRAIMKKWEKDRISENILNRNFREGRPYEKVWTDITYLFYKWWRCYLSISKDMVTWEILSYKLSRTIWMDLWIDVAKDTIKKCSKWVLIHSDQWVHYTNPMYRNTLKEWWAIQSMSRKWVCIDNAPTETWFWHMKDEIEIENLIKYEEVEKEVIKYINYYNNKRPQRDKQKMTPVEYRSHLLSN